MAGIVNINGKTYRGNNISINNNIVIIDGKRVDEDDQKMINITIYNIESIKVDVCNSLVVKGTVGGNVETMSGDIDITGEVKGNVTTSSGDVSCGNIHGDVTTSSGDIKFKR